MIEPAHELFDVYDVRMSDKTVGKLLHQLGYGRAAGARGLDLR
ncbi:MAG: hypothetical protein SFX73_35915 [Kofleriaceae bacterium]|nr:hypothetical protein [Kofleriaceae bacterium]